MGCAAGRHLLQRLPAHTAAGVPADLAANVLAAAAAAGDSDSLFHLCSWLPACQQLSAGQLVATLQAALHCRQPTCEYGSSECVQRLLELPAAAAAVTAQQAARLLADVLQPGSSSSSSSSSSSGSSSSAALVVFQLCRGLPAVHEIEPHDVACLLFSAVEYGDWLSVQSLVALAGAAHIGAAAADRLLAAAAGSGCRMKVLAVRDSAMMQL
uniref:Uncharacterized protein n=1 Tax=Tetradesmus obliquus TaxID=3088 RepID=A0A383W2D1_TETOB